MTSLLLVDLEQRRAGHIDPAPFAEFTERHHITPPAIITEAEVGQALAGAHDVLLRVHGGLPSDEEMELIRSTLARSRRVYLYWPREDAVEVVTKERYDSWGRHRAARELFWQWRELQYRRERAKADKLAEKRVAELERAERRAAAQKVEPTSQELKPRGPRPPREEAFDFIRVQDGIRKAGQGLYFRLDYWAKIKSGGSYGHTCYQAKALRRASSDLICVLGSRFELLDEMGITQIVLPPQTPLQDEYSVASNGEGYGDLVEAIIRTYKPSYVFERTVLGNCTVAKACSKYGIPYIAEYNGSELTMSRVFGGREMANADTFLECERVSFETADIISVISDPVKDELVARGIPAEKILTNPNGVDLDVYRRPPPEERAQLRASLGFSETDRVLGFCATFGGWHGVEVLAEALPRICAADPRAKFLLIGSGHHKPMVLDAIERAGLTDRVYDAGTVPQLEASRLLGACDIFLSPHSKNMGDQPFFGSPTKLFEYMGYEGGIVCSDLAQLGEVLRPALTIQEIKDGKRDPRARCILVAPGSVDDLVDASVVLVQDEALAEQMGRNALQAARDFYTWDVHVETLWRFARNEALGGYNLDRSNT